MIDDSDVGDVFAFFPVMGPISFGVMLIVGGIVWYVACQNDKECAAKTCAPGETAQLIDHDCRCVGAAPR